MKEFTFLSVLVITTLLLFTFGTYIVSAINAVSNSELYTVYDYKDVVIFRVNRDCFSYIKNNFYVYVSQEQEGFLKKLEPVIDFVNEKYREFMPPGLDFKKIDLDMAEKRGENLDTLLEKLLMHNDVYLVFSYRNITNDNKLISYRVIAKFSSIEKIINIEDIKGNISSFKKYLLKTIISMRPGNEPLHDIISKLMSIHGIQRYDIIELIVFDDSIREIVELYIDEQNMPTEQLKEIGEKIKNSDKCINIVMIFDQPWNPYDYYTRLNILSSDLYNTLKNEIPCFNGIGFTVLYINLIHFNYDCIIINTSNSKEDKYLSKILDDIIFKLCNLKNYSNLFKKGTWVITIEPIATITARGPSHDQYGNETSENRGSRTSSSLYQRISVIIIPLVAISTILMIKKIYRH